MEEQKAHASSDQTRRPQQDQPDNNEKSDCQQVQLAGAAVNPSRQTDTGVESVSLNSISNPAEPTSATIPRASLASADPFPSTPDPGLRFPRPLGNRHLASWISSSHPGIMASSSGDYEVSYLSESTFEIINTDDESQDGQTNESLQSFDQDRSDDVHSLTGTDQSGSGLDTDEETDEEVDAERGGEVRRISDVSIQYTEEILQNPSPRVATPVNDSEDFLEQTTSTIVPHPSESIEFLEVRDPTHLEQISVKHTIRGFSEQESEAMCHSMNLAKPSQRLMATVRQTMAQHCLRISGPLHVLYVGNPTGRHPIMSKISSALQATSVKQDISEKIDSLADAPTKLGSIFVENCTEAREIIYQGSQFPGETVYTLTIDDERTYESAFRPSGSIIEPSYVKPHIAVFYITDIDSEEDVRTRSAVWGLTKRHGIPAIFISSSQIFDRPAYQWAPCVGQHAVHLCLESSDPSVTPTRLPIDIKSFLNIDARQMNRNLACLTGLHEQTALEREPNKKSTGTVFKAHPGYFKNGTRWVQRQLFDGEVRVWTILRLALVLTTATAALWGIQLFKDSAIPSTEVCSTDAPAGVSSTASLAPMTPDTIDVINLTTSSTTVQIPRAHTSPGTSAVLPISSYNSDLKHNDVSKMPLCSAEVYGSNEILVKIPLSTKTTWLAKDSITIDVFRGGDAVKTKFSSVDKGLLIEVPQRQAHGVISVTIVTSRKPKVNETFQVNFGKSIVGEALDWGKAMTGLMTSFTTEVSDQVHLAGGKIQDQVRGTSQGLQERLASSLDQKWREILMKTLDSSKQGSKAVEDFADRVKLSLIKAQITSRLAWLKLQGKAEESEEYRRKGDAYIEKRVTEASQAFRDRHSVNEQTKCGCGAFKRLWSCGRERTSEKEEK